MRNTLPFVLLLASCSSWYEHPDLGPTPPPVIGGTLIVTRDGAFAVAADPARNLVATMNLATRELSTVALERGDEPGRLVEDGAGRIHVALRRSGAIATIAGGQVVSRREACPEPRGIAWQASTDQVHVACEGGELVTFAAAGGPAVRTVRVERDLRDVLVVGDRLVVTTFRTAELISLDGQGRELNRTKPTGIMRNAFDGSGITTREAVPNVAYRALSLPTGEVLMVHQRATGGPLGVTATTSNGYYAPVECAGEGPVESTVSFIPPDLSGPIRLPTDGSAEKPQVNRRLPHGVVPVDVAISPDGGWIAVVLAGTRTVRLIGRTTLPTNEFADPCGLEPTDIDITAAHEGFGVPDSIAFTPAGALVIQWDNVITVEGLGGSTGPTGGYTLLPEPHTVDPGRQLFVRVTSSGLACASCHPEGREDSIVWDFGPDGLRRTQMVAGFLAERAPYHWTADMPDLRTLTEEVMVKRMGGEELDAEEMFALTYWLGELRPLNPASPVDADAVARGRAVFDDSGCATCHTGAIYTNNTRVAVGTGAPFKVPSLIGVGSRAPFMHDGCARTLRDRFGPCGGGQEHGNTQYLSEGEMVDLIAFLESL